ncbi:MAG: branched-chain amino acid ABC transporter permease [Acidimicrobiia bacterium]
MVQFSSAVIGGLTLGAIYALVALGVVLIFRATDTFNFAHGQFMLLGAFLVGKWQLDSAAPFMVILAASLLIVGAVGAALYWIVLRKTVGRPHFIPVIATLGFAAVADGAMSRIFGSRQYVIQVPGMPTGTTKILGASFSTASLVITVFATVLALSVVLAFRYTSIGIKVRAAGQDPLLASQGGVNVHWVYVGSWAFSCVLAAVAGIAYGSINVANPGMIELAMLAFPAALLGGLDSIPGSLLGGMMIGLLQGFTASYVGGEYVNVVTYVLLLVVMLFMPQGLLGTQKVSRV